jgi:hypothetical protein
MPGNALGVLRAKCLHLNSNQEVEVILGDVFRDHRTLGALRVAWSLNSGLPIRTWRAFAPFAGSSRPVASREARSPTAVIASVSAAFSAVVSAWRSAAWAAIATSCAFSATI